MFVLDTRNDDLSLYYEGCLKVYDVTKYHKGHPGGADIMIENGGTNAYSLFAAAVHSDMALKQMTKYCIGCVAVRQLHFLK